MEAAEIFQEINKARTDPKSYANVVAARKDKMNGHILTLGGQAVVTKEGNAAIDEAIQFLQDMQPVSPLEKIVEEMCEACKAHVEDIGASGLATHMGSDGSDPVSRLADRGQWGDVVGENLDFGSDSAVDVVVSMIIDDGWEGKRVHRINVVDPDFKVVGIASGEHAKAKVMTCVVFANAFGEDVPIQQKNKVRELLQASGRADDVSEAKIDEFVASLQDPSKTVWLAPSEPEAVPEEETETELAPPAEEPTASAEEPTAPAEEPTAPAEEPTAPVEEPTADEAPAAPASADAAPPEVTE